MKDLVLVELCAGSAAFSLAWLSADARPPLPYQGNKARAAREMHGVLGMRLGGGARAGRVVLVEKGPWGEAWGRWRTHEGRQATADILLSWAAAEPTRATWERLRLAPVPTDVDVRVATWAALQRISFGSFPVFPVAGRWRWSQRAGRKTPHTLVGPRQEIDALSLRELAARIEGLPDLARAEVVHADVTDVAPIPGAIVLFDPPYEGVTAYGEELTREEVLQVARRWRDAGCTVAVCEDEPLPLDGWHHYRVRAARSEWMTLSSPPVGRLPFAAEGVAFSA